LLPEILGCDRLSEKRRGKHAQISNSGWLMRALRRLARSRFQLHRTRISPQRTFTRFAIDNQLLAVDPAPAPQLHAAFRDFVTVNQSDNAPQGAVRTDSPWSDYIRWGYGLHG
jgi:hypothetical protein